MNLSDLPGGDLVQIGLQDASKGVVSEASLLVSLAAPKLRSCGIEVPVLSGVTGLYEHALYLLLAEQDELSAHSKYNALIQRIVSFANACDHVQPSR